MRKNLATPWSSISDLMSALMMVFLFISVSYAFQVSKQAQELAQKSEKIDEITSDYAEKNLAIYNDLVNSFSSRLDEWKATIDKDTLTFRFNDPALLFEPGSAELTPRFIIILEEFWSEYVTILSRHSSSIREVKIEGHTSSEWANATLDESYFNNMKLSQHRTRTTLEQCYTSTPDKDKEWVRAYVTANGMSFSRLIKDDRGLEDEARSRRVEFTIVVDARSRLNKIMGELND